MSTASAKGHIVDDFKRAVTAAINKRQLSMSQVAIDAGITRAYLYRVLSGEHIPSVEVAERIANAVGLKLKLSRLG